MQSTTSMSSIFWLASQYLKFSAGVIPSIASIVGIWVILFSNSIFNPVFANFDLLMASESLSTSSKSILFTFEASSNVRHEHISNTGFS